MAQLPYIPRALRLVWAASREWTLAWAFLLVAQGLLPVATVYLTRALVNSVVAVWNSGGGSWDKLKPVLLLAFAMGAVLLLAEICRSVSAWIRTAQSDLVRDHIAALIHEKSVAAD